MHNKPTSKKALDLRKVWEEIQSRKRSIPINVRRRVKHDDIKNNNSIKLKKDQKSKTERMQKGKIIDNQFPPPHIIKANANIRHCPTSLGTNSASFSENSPSNFKFLKRTIKQARLSQATTAQKKEEREIMPERIKQKSKPVFIGEEIYTVLIHI